MKPTNKKSDAKERFMETHKTHTENELLVELIWNLKRNYHLQEKVRQNTSKLVWWLIAIPFIAGAFIVFLGFAGINSI
ncbi:MAG: hypothetical protein ACSHW7_00035 [Patiriisocius sp.]|uniref:hypothetical protein n=1 Tax=Patiriisocius sp. TaxID=2822396 RepID=UPI003EF71277